MYVNTVHFTEDAYAKWFIQFNTILVEPVAMESDKGESSVKYSSCHVPKVIICYTVLDNTIKPWAEKKEKHNNSTNFFNFNTIYRNTLEYELLYKSILRAFVNIEGNQAIDVFIVFIYNWYKQV